MCGARARSFDDASGRKEETNETSSASSKPFYSAQADSGFPEQEQQASGETTRKRMRLFLRELAVLKKAAKAAGGDLKVSLQPVGISSEELVESLARLDWFDISPGDDAVMIRSREEDPYVAQMRAEVDQLEQKRNALMKDVKELERLLVQGEDKLRSLQEAVASQRQPSNAFQDRGVVRPQGSSQSGVVSVPATFPGQRFPDQNPAQGSSRPMRPQQEEGDEVEMEESAAPFSPNSTVMLAPSTKGVKTK
ncbi:MAG: hypothetical protein V1746_00530 [bacterium]